jgi:hypothetical protein
MVYDHRERTVLYSTVRADAKAHGAGFTLTVCSIGEGTQRSRLKASYEPVGIVYVYYSTCTGSRVLLITRSRPQCHIFGRQGNETVTSHWLCTRERYLKASRKIKRSKAITQIVGGGRGVRPAEIGPQIFDGPGPPCRAAP